MLARSGYLLAALLLVASLLGIRSGTRSVAHEAVTLPGGIPAVLYEPGPPRSFKERGASNRRLPVVVLAHGFSGNQGTMGVLARRLARAGYAVLTFDFRGHGRNRARLGPGRSREGLYEDLNAAVRYAASRPTLDAERLVLAGHSMGAGAVFGYASREPDAAAVIGISGGFAPDGPYPIPNALLLFASRDPSSIRQMSRQAGAELAGLERLILERTYGDPGRGSAVRISEVDGASHVTILYSREAALRVVSWLHRAVGPPGGEALEPGADGRFAWASLGLISALLLLFGAPSAFRRLLEPVERRGLSRPVRSLLELSVAHAAALLLLSAQDPATGEGPLGLLPIADGGDLVVFLLLSGLLLFGVRLVGGDAAPPKSLPSGHAILVAGSVALAGYVMLIGVLSPLLELRIAPHRLPFSVLSSLLVIPFFLATEWSLREDGRRRLWVSPAGRVVTLLFLAGSALLGLLPLFVLLGMGGLVLLSLLFEIVGLAFARETSDPWVPALTQALWAGWTAGALFPLLG